MAWNRRDSRKARISPYMANMESAFRNYTIGNTFWMNYHLRNAFDWYLGTFFLGEEND